MHVLWWLVAFLFILPWLILIVLGLYWLSGNHEWLPFLWLSASSYGVMLILTGYLRRKGWAPFQKRKAIPSNVADSHTVDTAKAAVNTLVAELDPKVYPPTDIAQLTKLSREIIHLVAQHFHPEQKQPELTITVPELLLLIERVSSDMRGLLAQHVPFSHLLTINTGLRFLDWKERLDTLHVTGRIARMAFNPIEGIAREIGGVFFGKAVSYPIDQLETWFLRSLAAEIGNYAIQLYSGRLVIDTNRLESFVTSASEKAALKAEEAETRLQHEPLRLVVIGQLKAGKSSLVNALFGEIRAGSDALPCTDNFEPYRLFREGMEEALIFDSPGYGENEVWLEKHWDTLYEMDLLMMVCSVTQAGREADTRFLTKWKERFDAHLHRKQPPILVVLTHIDQLRPVREWQPPYDLRDTSREKTRQIKTAVENLADTLHIPTEWILPVCLLPEGVYNLESVWTTIAQQLPESRRARYLRILPHIKDRENWDMILQQMDNAGRRITKGIKEFLS